MHAKLCFFFGKNWIFLFLQNIFKKSVGMYKILYFYYKFARHGPRGYRGAAKKRYGRARSRNSIFVSKFRDGGYTGAVCLPPIPRNFQQKINNSQNLQRSCGISKFLGNLGNSPELPNLYRNLRVGYFKVFFGKLRLCHKLKLPHPRIFATVLHVLTFYINLDYWI